MPGYRTHLVGGAFFGTIALVGAVWFGYLTQDPLTMAALMGFCLLGALFPDVDTDSIGQRLFYGVFAAVDLGLMYHKKFEWAAWLGLFAMLPAIGAHRGWTHTWWAMFIVPLPILALPYMITQEPVMDIFVKCYIAFAVGYFSHLLLDGEFG